MTFNTSTTYNKQNQHLSSLRDWLLLMLMNGQVTVSLSGRAESKSAKKGYYKDDEFEFGIAAEGEGEYK